MEEVVDATGAGVRRRAPVSSTDQDNENQQQSLPTFSRLASNLSQQVNKVNKYNGHKRALPFSSAGVLLPDENVRPFRATSSGLSNRSTGSVCSRSDMMKGLENGIDVKQESDGGRDSLADVCGVNSTSPSIDAGVGGNQMAQSEQIDEPQRNRRNLRRAGRLGTQNKGGSISMLRGRGLVRAVRGELEKAAAGSAQAAQASMQVL
jgi:hypothetical protein